MTRKPDDVPAAVRARDEEGPPLPQMIAQRRAIHEAECASTPSPSAGLRERIEEWLRWWDDRSGPRSAPHNSAELLREAAATLAQPAPSAGLRLTEQQRHDIEHMRFEAARSTPQKPLCCFDYELVRGVLAVLDAALAQPVPSYERFRHKKTGGIYRVIAQGQIEADLTHVVIYQGERNGCVWVRPSVEFFDGRFERLSETASAPAQPVLSEQENSNAR